MTAATILVVDDDAWILRMVTTVLEKKGYQVHTAKDGEEGLTAAEQHGPDLVISDIMMPRLDGWAFVRALRAHPRFAFTPVIFLTALSGDEDRIRGFKLGADDYLPKPFRFEELDLRIGRLLRRQPERELREKVGLVPPAEDTATVTIEAEPPPSAGPTPGLHGSLDSVGLASLLTILDLDRKTGLLVVSRDGETGRIWLRNGRVLAASLDERPGVRNADVIYHLLGWAAGQFELTITPIDVPDEIGAATTSLLMEGARRLDEQQKRA